MRYLYIFLDGTLARSDDKPTARDLKAIEDNQLTVVYLAGPCYVGPDNKLYDIEETKLMYGDDGEFHENPGEPNEYDDDEEFEEYDEDIDDDDDTEEFVEEWQEYAEEEE